LSPSGSASTTQLASGGCPTSTCRTERRTRTRRRGQGDSIDHDGGKSARHTVIAVGAYSAPIAGFARQAQLEDSLIPLGQHGGFGRAPQRTVPAAIDLGGIPAMKLRLLVAVLAVGIAASFAVATPALAASSHWTKHQAARHYLHDVRPSNKQLDRWDKLAKDSLQVGPLTKQAGRVAQSEIVFVQRLIRGQWTSHVDKLIKKLEVRVLNEVRRWQDVASARTIIELQHAVTKLPNGSRAANRVRRALGLPTV
jgi:hypothetical protein